MKRAHLTAVGLTVAALLGGVRCIPTYEFGGSNEGDGGPHIVIDATFPGDDDGAASTDATLDGTKGTGDDAPVVTPIDAPTSFPATPTTILPSTGIPTATGNAQQQHLIFATNSQRWWFFYIDADPKLLKTMWSIDFATWTSGASLTLPMAHGGEGRNFSVAYKNISGRDVIHAATSLHDPPKRIVWDTRATIAGATVTWETPILVHDLDVVDNIPDGGLTEAGSQGGDSCDPDGPGVAFGADDRVTIATSWVSVPGCCSCDSNFGTSLQPDNGAAWDAGFQAPLSHITVPGTTSARQILGLANGTLLAGWEAADGVPPSNEGWGVKTAGEWSETYSDPTNYVFAEPTPTPIQEKNDWSFCRIDDNDIHAVRRKYTLLADGGSTGQSQVFEHYRFNGSAWTFQSTLANDPGIPGSGVTLVTNGKDLLVAAIAQDAADSIRFATWNGTAWGAWASLPSTVGTNTRRAYVSGTSCADPTHPAILWTEGAAAPYQVIAVPVTALMP